MSDVVVMKILYSRGYLFYDGSSLELSQYLILLQLGVQSALFHVFQHDKQVCTIVKESVNTEDIFMT